MSRCCWNRSCRLSFSLCNKKRIAIRYMNTPLFPSTLSIPSYDIVKLVRLRTYQQPLVFQTAFCPQCVFQCLTVNGNYFRYSTERLAIVWMHWIFMYLCPKALKHTCSNFMFHFAALDLAGSVQSGYKDTNVRLILVPAVDNRKRQTTIHRNNSNPFFMSTLSSLCHTKTYSTSLWCRR